MSRLVVLSLMVVSACGGSDDSGSTSFRVGLSPSEGERLCREHCKLRVFEDPQDCHRSCRDYVGDVCGRETALQLRCELDASASDPEAFFQMIEDCRDAGDKKACRDELFARCGKGGVGGTQCKPETLTGLACVEDGRECDRQQWACFISGGDCDADYADAICNDNFRRGYLSCSVQECIRIQNERIETGVQVIGDSCTPLP